MKTCQSGRVITKKRKDKNYFYLRLNLVDIDDASSKRKYTTKDISTGLLANKRNKAKASALLEDAITEYSTCEDRMYFHNYLKRWLENKKPTLEVTTYEGYEYRLRVPIKYFSEKKILLTDLKPEHIRDFYNAMFTMEHGEGKRHKVGYSNRSVKDTAILIRSSLTDAVINGYIAKSPAAKIKTPKKPENIKKRAYIGVDEVNIFFDAIKDHILEVPFLLTIYYGLRREEVLGLRWSAIHDDGRLYIEHTVSRVKTTIEKDRTKTDASYRSYPIPAEIRDKLAKIRDRQENNRILFGNEYQNSDYIFTWDDGHLFSPDYLTKSFKKIIRQDDRLDDTLTLHSLRASCVSILVHQGMDIKDIQEWVGHKDIQTTLNIYARTNEKQKNKVADSLTKAMFLEKTG